MKKALEGIVVLDFTRYEAGPHATYLLGQMGAYIIKVEKAIVGDDERLYPPMFNGESLAFPLHNMPKYSLSMDLRNARAKEILLELIPHVDVLTQNYRAGTIEKMGLDWETIHKLNPRLIMANNSGFGQFGPYSNRLAFDSIIQSEAGIINSIIDEGADRPFYPGGNPSDHLGALFYANSILAAINQRDRTGEGQYLEVDMMSASSTMFSPQLCIYGATGEIRKTNDLAPCGYFRDKNGKYMQISCPPQHWGALKELAGVPELNSIKFSSVEGRMQHKAELTEYLETWTVQHDGEALRKQLEAKGIGASVIRDFKDIVVNEHVKATGYFKDIEVPYVGTAPYPDMPFTMSESPVDFHRAPKLGEHNAEILGRFLGMSAEKVAQLTEEGVLYQAEHARWK